MYKNIFLNIVILIIEIQFTNYGTNSYSGASIDDSARRNNVTILETDQAYGLLEFMPGGVLPQTNDPLIPPADVMPRV